MMALVTTAIAVDMAIAADTEFTARSYRVANKNAFAPTGIAANSRRIDVQSGGRSNTAVASVSAMIGYTTSFKMTISRLEREMVCRMTGSANWIVASVAERMATK